MAYEQEIERLESEWLAEDGFFWRIRQGQFDLSHFQRVLRKVRAISIGEDAELPRRLVSLLWYIPLFMLWQVERVVVNGNSGTEYATAISRMTNEIERLLGVP